VGTLSFWMSEASGLAAGSTDGVLSLTILELWHEDGKWVAVSGGSAREWHRCRKAAEHRLGPGRWDPDCWRSVDTLTGTP
jgi:hypothetical protein